MIVVHSLTKFYSTDFWKEKFKALDDVSFSVKEGSITGFLGANGAGKTTTIKIVLGITRPDSGTICYGKFNQDRISFLKFLGYMPERPYFYQNISGRDLIRYFSELHDMKFVDFTQKLNYWAKRMSLDHAINKDIKTYSKGMLQRLGIISAVIHSPGFIILDEPVAGLDPIGRTEIKDVLVELNKKSGTTIFFSTHIIPDVEEVCDQIVFLKKGKLIYAGPLEEFIKDDNQSYTIKFSENGQTQQKTIPSEKRDQMLKELLANGSKILQVKSNNPTLEEVLYKNER